VKALVKTFIMGLVIFNIYIGFLFYNVAIPVKVTISETLIISRLSSHFGIPIEIAKIFYSHGKLNNEDPVLLASIAQVESNNNPNAVSPKKYSGRMQSSTVKLPDTVEILNGTTKLVEFKKLAKGDMHKALQMYNGGVRPHVYNSGECRQYASKVLTIYNQAKPAIYSL